MRQRKPGRHGIHFKTYLGTLWRHILASTAAAAILLSAALLINGDTGVDAESEGSRPA